MSFLLVCVNIQDTTHLDQPSYKYLVRLINPQQKSKHVTKMWHGVTERFVDVDQLKRKLQSDFGDKLPPFPAIEFGYLEKNSKRWIEDERDLDAMYKGLAVGDEITLWCDANTEEHTSNTLSKGTSRKRKAATENEDAPSLKRSEKIDQLTSELHEKHGEKYGMPHLRIWARMILNNQHNSTDTPPSFPLFNDGPKRTKRDNLSDALTSAATAVVGMLKGNDQPTNAQIECISPGKKARISGQYLEHLERLNSLHQSGVLTSEEFTEQKEFALKNIRKLND